jgi:flagellar basal-body rod protein FlgF
MQDSLYVTLSAQVALENRMTGIASNVANINTAGFRGEEIKFDTYLSKAASDPVSFASTGKPYITRQAGSVNYTGNSLDVAVSGNAWLAIQTPGGVVYTRDGRMTISEAGTLQTVAGHAVLDPGGAEILIDANAGPVAIGRDGTMAQNGVQVGALGLFEIGEDANLTRWENSGVKPDRPPMPVADFAANGVEQGYVEGSNVNPISEMTRLITVTRAFEAIANATQTTESSMQDAIEKLGRVS